MSVLGWIFFGAITGWLGSLIVNSRGQGCFLNIALGLVGAMVGGFIFSAIGGSSITGFNVYSMLVAIVGAIVVLFLWHAVTGSKSLR
jgi:uncharacterized membrane protein YeaQ/YmgE (transglycosylase-associated protein family)